MASSGGTGRIGWVVIAAVAAALVVTIGRAGADAPNGSGGNAATFTGSAMIGPLLAADSDAHSCTASVVDSPGHNLIMTAAHCVQGTGAGMRFIPKYQQSSAPYGAWVVHAVYVDPQWQTNQNPLRDWAFLAVTPHTSQGATVNIQDLTSAFRLGFKWHSGDSVTVSGYYKGANGPTTCTDQLSQHNQYAEFKCEGFGAGIRRAAAQRTVRLSANRRRHRWAPGRRLHRRRLVRLAAGVAVVPDLLAGRVWRAVRPGADAGQGALLSESDRQQLAATFDTAAELYDSVRPGFAEAAVDWVLPEATGPVLDSPLAPASSPPRWWHGLEVVAADPAPNMLAVLRRRL
jgi:hypothetical protein